MSIELSGQKFTRLTVIKSYKKNKWNQQLWSCVCDCGNKKNITSYQLNGGGTKSCGCLQREKVTQRNTKHNHARRNNKSKIYVSWKAMRQRCMDHNSKDYSNYGGRGIVVCKRWEKFENFLEDMGNPPTELHQIDRIDNNQGYSPNNCRWITLGQQQRNKGNNRLETYSGKTQCLAAWAEEYSIDYKLLWKRICVYKWLIGRALSTPKKSVRSVQL